MLTDAIARANAAANNAQKAAEKAAMLRKMLMDGFGDQTINHEEVIQTKQEHAQEHTQEHTHYNFPNEAVHGPLYWDGIYDSTELKRRAAVISNHFSNAVGIDDFMIRIETILATLGFQASNTIAVCNLCRDEITQDMRRRIENVYGMPFITQGLGAVITSGKTGFSAALHHAPLEKKSAKGKVVFFSLPHIAIDADGEVGTVFRPGRYGKSNACGALIGALNEFKCQSINKIKTTSVDMNDPEFSILKNRLCQGMEHENMIPSHMNLVQMTKLAERQITKDLETLIEQTVDSDKFDYAVCTGIHIHQWSCSGPRCDYVSPCSMYAVVKNTRHEIELSTTSPLPTRLIRLIENASSNVTN